MAPRQPNAKKEAGRAKKTENESKKKESAAAEKQRLEEEKWNDGSKSNKSKEEKEAKKKADSARKLEAARLLAEEEASIATKKPSPKAGKKSDKPAGPGALAAQKSGDANEDGKEEPVTLYASGLDDALEMLELVTAKTDNASVGQQAAGIERHPERRFKAAFEAYQERELPNIRKDHPGLRLQQYKELLYKQFQKAPDNPFNQMTISYDASKEERLEVLDTKKKTAEQRFLESKPVDPTIIPE